jgi:hypothetical protein
MNCYSETQSFNPFQAAKKKKKKDGLFLAKLWSPLINYLYMLSAFQTFYLPCTAGLTTWLNSEKWPDELVVGL